MLRITLVCVTLVLMWRILTQKIKLYNNSVKLLLFYFFLHIILGAILWPGQMYVLVCNKLNKKAVIAQCPNKSTFYSSCAKTFLCRLELEFSFMLKILSRTSSNILVCFHCQYKD